MTATEEKLLACFRGLRDEQRDSLLEYAEFLAARHPPRKLEVREPQHQPAPENETVIAAIKRLSTTYEMLDKGTMLHEISSLMAEHVMQGRPAHEVIGELEQVFAHKYETFREENR